MKINCKRLMLLASSLAILSQAHAAYNATVVGTVETVTQMSTTLQYTPETLVFTLSNSPNATWCGPFHSFVISPSSVADAQTRKNMIAILLTAKAAGGQVQVAFDNAGGFCDQGLMGVYYIVAL